MNDNVRTCPAAEVLERFLNSALDEAELEDIAAHLNSCASCRARIEHSTEQSALADDVRNAARQREQTPVDVSVPVARLNELFKDYQILGEIGRGGMGVVYRARQLKLKRLVALKVLPALLSAVRPDSAARFRREAELAGRLKHSNIIAVHDFGEIDGTLYYAMELVEGRSLREVLAEIAESGAIDVVLEAGSSASRIADCGSRIEEKAAIQLSNEATSAPPHGQSEIRNPKSAMGRASSLPLTRLGSSSRSDRAYFRRVAGWIADVAEALEYAHEQGVIHRDVKPSNLLLAADGRLMISDFGLARGGGVETLTATRSLLGTARYMAPEQADEAPERIDRRADVYGLGATLYELLAFRPMFAGADDREVLDCVLNKEPAPPHRLVRQVPRELETICLKAVEKDRGRRYPTAKDLADDLRRWLLDRPITARRAGPLVRVGKFVRRRKLPVALGAALLIAVIATVAVTTRAVRDSRLAAESALQVRTQRVALLQAEAADAFHDRRYRDALAALDQALLDVPEDRDVRRGRAWMIRHVGCEAEAAELLEAMCQEAPDDWLTHHYLSMLYRDWEETPAGKLEEHVRALNELVPDTARAYYAQSLAEPDDGKAIALLDRAFEQDPGLLEIVLARGSRHAKLGDYESELRDADRAVAMAPKAAFAHADRGHALFNLQRYDEAEQAYGRAIELDPAHALYWHHRALARSAAGRFDLALSDATRAIELDENLARAYLARARAHAGRGAFDAALQDCNRGIALDPENFNFHLDRSVLFNQLGRFEEMLADCTWVVELAPDDPRGYENRIAALAALNRLERAIPDAERIVQLQPDDPRAHGARLKLMYRLHRFEEAIASASRIIDLNGGQRATDFEDRGRLHLITGRPDLALADLTRAVELDPSRPVTRAYRAAAYADLNQIDLALADLDAIHADEGTLPAYVALWRYVLLAEHGRPAEAEESLRGAKQLLADVWTDQLIDFMAGDLPAADLLEAAANDDERAEAHYYHGMRLMLDGQPDAARAELTACVELNRELVETDFARAFSILLPPPATGPPAASDGRCTDPSLSAPGAPWPGCRG